MTSYFIWHKIKHAAALQALKQQMVSHICVESKSSGRKSLQLHTQHTVILPSLLNTMSVGYLI